MTPTATTEIATITRRLESQDVLTPGELDLLFDSLHIETAKREGDLFGDHRGEGK